jgi:hypothetical protein
MAEDPISTLERELVSAARRRAVSAIAPQAPAAALRGVPALVIGSFSERRQAQMRQQPRRVGWPLAAFLVALVACVAAAVLLVVLS